MTLAVSWTHSHATGAGLVQPLPRVPPLRIRCAPHDHSPIQ